MAAKKIPSTWSLIRPYWFSEERWRAYGLLAIVLAATLALVYINVRVNLWSADFYDALQKKDWPVFVSQLEYFSVLAFSFIIVATAQIYFRQLLEIRWRRWITHQFLSAWLKDHAFYRIQRDHLADNPDQRIADDLKEMVSTTLALSLDLLSNLVTLVSFITILWSLSGPVSFLVLHQQVTIPGYMVWVAIAYAFAGSIFTQLYARRLSAISYQQQRYEADFRYLLVRVRENAEQIALYHGGEAEHGTLTTSFGRIRENWRLIMTYTKRLTLVTNSYTQAAVIFPMVVAAPRYFAGALTFGVLIQLSNGFGQVSSSLSWFINNYSALATWRATINRLREVQAAFEASEQSGGIVFTSSSAAAGLATSGLALALPDGRRLADIGSWEIQPGSRWLVRGPSGCGKSTLMRTMAGLWPFGQGTVERPTGGRQLFLPQQSYLPIGTLKAALCYPSAPDAFTDEECRAALRACRLELDQQLEDNANWSHVLSPGEQQRLAAARAILQRPDYLFLDEATSSLDLPTERAVYEALLGHLPNTAFVSVAHGEELVSLHSSVLNLHAAPIR